MSEEKQVQAKEQELVPVTLEKHHIHAGIEYAPGEKIKVRPDQARWLKELGVIK